MQLNINDEKKFSDPTRQVLSRELRGVDADEFAILSRGEERFIQMYHNDDDSFELEYREGAHDKHFGANTNAATMDDLIACFVGYLENDAERWQGAFAWERIEFDPNFQGDDFLTHYVLNDQKYPRIRVGREQNWDAAEVCPECGAELANFHEAECSLEECPGCHDRLQGCRCE